MTKVLVLYYSMYGHIETMANSVAEGARKVDGVEVTVKRVAETMDPEALKAAGGKTDQGAPVASPQELADYDAIIFGTPTRFGNMAGQMRIFLDQTGGLWAGGGLVGKVASVFTSTGTGGGEEMTITSNLDHAGPPRDDHRTGRLRHTGAVRYFSGRWGNALWCFHYRGRGWLTPA